MKALFFLLAPLIALAGGDSTYLNVNSWEAKKEITKILTADPALLPTDAERIEWVKARLAAISLARLETREAEALKLFLECGKWCGKYGPEQEWASVKAWGCQKKREADICLSLSSSSVKTKAQKPPL